MDRLLPGDTPRLDQDVLAVLESSTPVAAGRRCSGETLADRLAPRRRLEAAGPRPVVRLTLRQVYQVAANAASGIRTGAKLVSDIVGSDFQSTLAPGGPGRLQTAAKRRTGQSFQIRPAQKVAYFSDETAEQQSKILY